MHSYHDVAAPIIPPGPDWAAPKLPFWPPGPWAWTPCWADPVLRSPAIPACWPDSPIAPDYLVVYPNCPLCPLYALLVACPILCPVGPPCTCPVWLISFYRYIIGSVYELNLILPIF